MIIGLVVDAACLKNWVARGYDYSFKIWMAIYAVYSICVLGFFMGVPLFNAVLAIPAGFFIGCRLAHAGATREECLRLARHTCIFTTVIMFLICFASAALALHDPNTGDNLRGMLRLPFDVTPAMIGWLIGLGGSALLCFQWWLVLKTIHLAYRWALRG